MSRQQRNRLIIAVVAIIAVVLVAFNVIRRPQPEATPIVPTQAPETLPAGTITLYQNGEMVASFTPADLAGLETSGFEDAVEGKLQNGALLRDVILLYVDEANLTADTQITVSSSERDKSVTLSWEDVANPDNHVLFDPASNRGTLKLVSSSLENLNDRSEWIQDTDRIDINTP